MKAIVAGLTIGAVAWFIFKVTPWFYTSSMLGLSSFEGKLLGIFLVVGIWVGTLWDQFSTLAKAHHRLVERLIELEDRMGGRY